MEKKLPKGYVPVYDRKCCEDCKFFFTNSGKVAPQERVWQCTKVNPPLDVHMEDICDEYEENK